MKNREELFRKCAVLFRNGAVFFSTTLMVRAVLRLSSRLMEYGGGYEPLYFLSLAGFLALCTFLLFSGESAIGKDSAAGQAFDFAGLSLLLLFVLLPSEGPLFSLVSMLAAAGALIRIPRLFRGCSPAAVLIGCAAAGVPGTMFRPAELIFVSAAAVCLLILFPPGRRILAAVLLCLILPVRLFFPVLFPEKNAGRTADPETLRSLYNLTLLACSETGDVPRTYQCVTREGISIGSPALLSMAVLAENTGGQDPGQFLESDVLRGETLSRAIRSGEGPGQAAAFGGRSPDGKTASAPPPRIFLFDSSRPTNFRTDFRCTENFFQRLKKSLPGDAVIGVLLPEPADPGTAPALSALRNTFPHTALFLFPGPMVLASSERPLTDDPEELDRRAVRGKVYERLFSPYHILNLALPHFQEPVAVSSLLDAAARAKPNRTDRLRVFRDPAPEREKWFSLLVKAVLPLTGALLVLYVILRYAAGWKPVRKSVFRTLETGFLLAGFPFLLAAPFLRSVEPDPVKWFPVYLSAAALGAAWAFSFAAGKWSAGAVPRLILPLLSLAFLLSFEPVSVWGLFLCSVLMGPAWKNAFLSACSPLTAEGEQGDRVPVFHASASLLGGALALFLIPPLFFVPYGMYAAALLLAVILATRRPAVLPA